MVLLVFLFHDGHNIIIIIITNSTLSHQLAWPFINYKQASKHQLKFIFIAVVHETECGITSCVVLLEEQKYIKIKY